ncbi:hypothetical protein [Polynucleobacter sp. AP-Nino-20-G2]|uniref:hypothetical protein n=1 Tax=Polynucleobacter sp. AP-Nino-20-G2 TaxID=2576917 RepID=UPI001BFEDA84|nr:hypothetical protein [Polynucleobacter sp. AP-Nino-20-G2]QWE16326.1 hypothetical protein FD960_08585 [Polynucleobacter sp. AP-Nino-20-G2]
MKAIANFSLYGVPALVGILVFTLVQYYFGDVNLFYEKNLRASLFTGFLTMGGFLLSLKTGILIKIKESLYDNKQYIEKVEELRTINPKLTQYGPLKRLSRVLSFSVFFCLLSASTQFTVGLLMNSWSTAFCLAIAAFSMSMLIASFLVIQLNLSKWFQFLEKGSDS